MFLLILLAGAIAHFPRFRAGCLGVLAGFAALYVGAVLFGAVGVLVVLALALVSLWRPKPHKLQ